MNTTHPVEGREYKTSVNKPFVFAITTAKFAFVDGITSSSYCPQIVPAIS